MTADHDHTLIFNGYAKCGNPILDIVRSYHDGQPARDADGKTYTTLVLGNGPNRKGERVDVTSEAALADGYHQETGVRLNRDAWWWRREVVRDRGRFAGVQGHDGEHQGVPFDECGVRVLTLANHAP